MTASLAYRKNEAAILAGDVPDKYKRILPHIPGDRIIELGSAEGVLACLLAKAGKTVTAMDGNSERMRAAYRLADIWQVPKGRVTFVDGKIGDDASLLLLGGHDTLVAVRMIYYLREQLDPVFSAVAQHIPTVVLCGNRNRADAWRAGHPHEPLGEWNRYASAEGMRALLERHGYGVTVAASEGDEIVIGRRG